MFIFLYFYVRYFFIFFNSNFLWIILLRFFRNFCDFLIFHYYTILISVHQLFLAYISFLTNFFIVLISNLFWIILLWILWNVCNSISNFITNQINHQFLLLLFELLFLKQSQMNLLKLFSMIMTFLAKSILCFCFCQYFYLYL